MTILLWNVLLALVWVAATGSFTPANLVAGFVLGFAVLWFSRRAMRSTSYFQRLHRTLALLLYFFKEVLVSNFRVAATVLRPGFHMQPAIVHIPLDAQTDAEITVLANLVTLTPGTISVNVSDDRKTLYVHAMFAADEEAVRRGIKTGFERRILEVLR
jgi:multicomponent Na+:H+ antiporter subunit E